MKKYLLLGCLIVLLGLCCGGRFYRLTQPASSFPLNLKWQINLGRSTYDRPVYQGGLVFFPANSIFRSAWYSLEATSGRTLWSQPIKRGSYYRCLTSGYLVVSGPRSLVTLKANTGEIVWEDDIGQTASCSETTVFAIVPRKFVVAYDLTTGQSVWQGMNPRYDVLGLIYNPEEEKLIAGARIVDSRSGQVLRSFEPPFLAYVPSDQGRGHMYLLDQGQLFIGGSVRDINTGQILHKEDRFSGYASPTVTEDAIYIADGGGYDYPSGVAAVDRDTYDVKWIYQPQHKIPRLRLITLSPVAIFDGVGYVIFSDATLRAFDLETGQELGYWQPETLDLLFWPACVSLPFPGCTRSSGFGMTTSEDTLFVSFGGGKLYAFGKE